MSLVPFLLYPPIKTSYTLQCHAIQRCLQEMSGHYNMLQVMTHDDIPMNYFQKCMMDNAAYEHDLRHYNNNTKDAEVGFINDLKEQKDMIYFFPRQGRKCR